MTEQKLADHRERDSLAEAGSLSGGDGSGFWRLLAPGIKLILIKGPPGSGKTTLAARLFDYVESAAYISTRVGLEKLSNQNLPLKHLESKKEQFREVTLVSKRVSYEDARLNFATDALKHVIEAASAKKDLIVLDAWDTIAKEMERVDRLKTEKAMAAFIDESASRLVFISEEPELTSTDYLADAIISLSYVKIPDGRRVRRITWEKLRGQPLYDRRSIYTLKDGVFTVFAKPKIHQNNGYRSMGKFPSPTPNTPTHFSTGSKDLDEFFGGGLKRGSFIVVEEGRTVGCDWHTPIYTLITLNFLLNGGTCLIVPSSQTTPEMILDGLSPYVDDQLLKSRVRISSYIKSIDHPSIVSLEGLSTNEAYEAQQKTALHIKGDNHLPTLWLLSMDTYETFSRGDAGNLPSYMARGTAQLRQYGDVTMMLAKSSTKNLQIISDNCDLHIKLEEVDGCLVMFAKRPPSSPYGVSFDFSKGYPGVLLTRVM
ncbi:MAG: gas vesicle protein GvpD P-loop domain-containing protein [Nitrososphaerales archaeon]